MPARQVPPSYSVPVQLPLCRCLLSCLAERSRLLRAFADTAPICVDGAAGLRVPAARARSVPYVT